jgi:hypothetical protein
MIYMGRDKYENEASTGGRGPGGWGAGGRRRRAAADSSLGPVATLPPHHRHRYPHPRRPQDLIRYGLPTDVW